MMTNEMFRTITSKDYDRMLKELQKALGKKRKYWSIIKGIIWAHTTFREPRKVLYKKDDISYFKVVDAEIWIQSTGRDVGKDKEEALATKIKCEHCGREIWVPGPLAQNPSRHTFYCPYCGQYTHVNGG